MEFGRLYTAMVTPFNEELEVDYNKAGDLALNILKNGSDGIIVSGTTGESPSLSSEEKGKLFRTVKAIVGNKGHIIAGTGCNDTKKSIELTKMAEEAGVDACMLVVPYYNKPPQEVLYKHFKLVSENTNLPIILYNVPGRTGINLEPETVARLSKIENIVGIKEASGCISQAMEIKSLTDDDFMIYCGEDCLTLPMLSIGAKGVISVASHVAGNEIKTMIDCYGKGDIEYARKINDKLYPIYKSMFLTTNPIPVKTAMNLLGHGLGEMRMPMELAQGEIRENIKNSLEEFGLKTYEK